MHEFPPAARADLPFGPKIVGNLGRHALRRRFSNALIKSSQCVQLGLVTAAKNRKENLSKCSCEPVIFGNGLRPLRGAAITIIGFL
jgi:hypothetical protein